MKKRFWKEFDEQETLEKIKINIEIRIELIKDTTKRATKKLRIDRTNKLNKIEEVKTVIKELRIEIKFSELANDLDTRSIKVSKKHILNIAEYITNGKNRKVKPADLSLKNKCIDYCFELTFGIISFSSHFSIEAINIISSDVEMNKILANNLNNLFYYCLNN